jgi:hypothetical protein
MRNDLNEATLLKSHPTLTCQRKTQTEITILKEALSKNVSKRPWERSKKK